MLEDWKRHLAANTYSKNVQAHYPVDVAVFMEFWGDHLVTGLGEQDIEAFTQVIATKCSKLQRNRLTRGGSMPQPNCTVGQDITRCPLLTGAKPDEYASHCVGYQALEPSAVLSYLRTLKAFYIWLVDQRAIKYTPVDPVFRRYKKRHKAWFIKRRARPQGRDWTMADAKTLIEHVPIRRQIIYALAAKCFLRMHEVFKLTIEPSHFSLEEGWIDIPDNPEYGDKRQGNTRIIIDAELRVLLATYLAWRSEHVRRDAEGQPVTNALVLTMYGLAWHPDSFRGAMRQQLRKDLKHAGIATGNEKTRDERLHFHGFRALATTEARNRGAPDAALQVMRGDMAPGSIGRYDRHEPRLPELYAKYGPQIGL